MATSSNSPDPEIIIEIEEFKSKRAKRSVVWEHCGFLKENGVVSKAFTVCKHCKAKMPYSGNTTTMKSHLDRHHYDAVYPQKPPSSAGSTGMYQFLVYFFIFLLKFYQSS